MNDRFRLTAPMIQVIAIGLGVTVIAVLVVGRLLDDGTELTTGRPIAGTTTTTTTQSPAVQRDARTPSTAALPPLAVVPESELQAAQDFGDLVVVIPAPTTAAPVPTIPTPEPIRIPRPTCADGLGPATEQVGPFTGRSALIPSGLPAVVVKVSNNDSRSRAALLGLDSADIVYEERIEANATRFAAVFHSDLPANVGPVRSGRTTDVQLIRNLASPVFGYSGSNRGVAAQIDQARVNGWIVPFVNTDQAPFARDSRFRAPDNLFVDPASLGACGTGGSPTPVLAHGAATSTSAVPASSVALDARSPYRFDWDPGSGRWLRSQDGTAHVTRSGAQLGTENVVVLFVPYVPSQIDAASVDAQTVGSGAAWTFRDGTVTEGTWSRPGPNAAWTLTDANGAGVTLAPGQTWVVLAPAGSASWG